MDKILAEFTSGIWGIAGVIIAIIIIGGIIEFIKIKKNKK